MGAIFAGEVTYTPRSTKQILVEMIAFDSRDWSLDAADAWLYGVVLGWDDDDPEYDAMADVAERHGWTAGDVALLRQLHEAFDAYEEVKS